MESKKLWRIQITFSINFILNVLISSLYWYYERFLQEKEKSLLLKNENLTSEINLLKAQISPHFLFNSLNNIYSLSLAKSDTAPLLIEKLSDILRYLIYQGKDEKVNLLDEIKLIEKYLEMHKLKKIRGGENIEFNYSGVNKNHKIVPLLLINFIENAFKHGDIQQNAAGYVHLDLKIIKEHLMILKVENSQKQKELETGIGLTNVKRQLELNYGKNFQLEIINENLKFYLELKLDVR